MADVNSVRLAEGKARRTPDMRLSNAEARHKTFREGFSVRRVSASSHAAFPRCNCRHSFDLQINKAAPPAGVHPFEQSPTSQCEDRALPGLSPVMDGSRRDNSRSSTSARHRPFHPAGGLPLAHRRWRSGRPVGWPQARRRCKRHRCLVPTPRCRNGHASHLAGSPGNGAGGHPLAIGARQCTYTYPFVDLGLGRADRCGARLAMLTLGFALLVSSVAG
jgi:hypothetical protein